MGQAGRGPFPRVWSAVAGLLVLMLAGLEPSPPATGQAGAPGVAAAGLSRDPAFAPAAGDGALAGRRKAPAAFASGSGAGDGASEGTAKRASPPAEGEASLPPGPTRAGAGVLAAPAARRPPATGEPTFGPAAAPPPEEAPAVGADPAPQAPVPEGGLPRESPDAGRDGYPRYRVVATGYTAGKESTGKSPGDPAYGITSSGVRVRRDTFSTIAADPTVFPIGSILYIPEYGYGVVADTGSRIKGYRIDLYFPTVDAVYREWGKRTVEVTLLVRGDGRLTEGELEGLNADAEAVLRRLWTDAEAAPDALGPAPLSGR